MCIYQNCSSKEIIIKKLNLLGVILISNGHLPYIIKISISEGEILIRIMSHTKKDENKSKNIIFFTVKYYKQESIVFASRVEEFCCQLLPNATI